MKVVSCLVGACVFITILCTVGAEEVAPGSVVDLNAETFSETSKGDWFVMFHAPWCGHCKKLTPVWSEFAQQVKTKEKPFKVARLDCTVHRQLCSENRVKSYPTLKVFLDGVSVQFTGKREIDSFFEFYEQTKSQSDEAKKELATVNSVPVDVSKVVTLMSETFEESISHGVWFVKYYAPWCGFCKQMENDWRLLSLSFTTDNFHVAKLDCTQHKELCATQDVKGYPSLRIYKQGKLLEIYLGERNFKSISDYIKANFPDYITEKEEL